MSDRRQSRWHDLRTMLTDWLAWLDETHQWVETTAVAAPSESCEQPWTRVEPDAIETAEAETSSPDLFALLTTMTALRQEVNLQTRSARRDREQAAQTLEQLSDIVAQIDQERQDGAKRRAAQEADYVHIDALLELHDALSRAERQASHLIAATATTLRAWGAWQPRLEDHEQDEPSEPAGGNDPTMAADGKTDTRGWWRRWFARPAAPPREVQAPATTHAPIDPDRGPDAAQALTQMIGEATRMADRLDALATGYRLSLQRMERVLSTHSIEPIACLGEAVDPELMEVVQVVADADAPPGTVTDEVRRGYRRHGRIYRFAQVVATRSEPSARLEPGNDTASADDTMAGECG